MIRNRATLMLLGSLAAAGALFWMGQGRGRRGWLVRRESDHPAILAFELGGHVGQPEIRAMADQVLAAFERFDEIDMLILLPDFTGLTPAAALDLHGMRASVRALGKVRRYAVVAPPAWAGTMIELSDWLIPVEARTFPLERLDEARAWLAEGRA